MEVERPATASGVLRGWLSNAVLRRATDTEEKIAPQASEVAAPQAPSEAPSDAGLRKKMARSIVNFEARRDVQGISAFTGCRLATAAVATKWPESMSVTIHKRQRNCGT